MKKLAILDDYQNVAMEMADWAPLAGDVEITVFNDHLADEDAVAERLKDFEIVMVMRERTPFPRSLLDKLPTTKTAKPAPAPGRRPSASASATRFWVSWVLVASGRTSPASGSLPVCR